MPAQYGYKLAAEAFGPAELVRRARLAEEAGFDFVEISDHFHPWLDAQGLARDRSGRRTRGEERKGARRQALGGGLHGGATA